MRKTDVEKIDFLIAEVFRLTGTRLTVDDPIVAVLLMQEQSFKAAFSEFADHQIEKRAEFLEEIATHESKITEAAAKLEQYREQLLLELAGQAGRQIENLEDKVYAAVSTRVISDVTLANAQLIAKLQKILLIYMVVLIAVLVVIVFI